MSGKKNEKKNARGIESVGQCFLSTFVSRDFLDSIDQILSVFRKVLETLTITASSDYSVVKFSRLILPVQCLSKSVSTLPQKKMTWKKNSRTVEI